MGFVQGDPGAILIVEYAGDTPAEVRSKVEALEAKRAAGRFGYASHIALESAEQQSIWKLRKAGLGLLLGTKGEAKPIAFIEDTAVDPEYLPVFVPRFRDIMAKHGAEGAYYGHCSVGCLHIRPFLDLSRPDQVELMQQVASEVVDLVAEFDGVNSSEHGDGRIRSPFNPRIFGDELYGAMREVKRLFDPAGVFNPGVMVDAEPLPIHIRDAEYPQPKPLETHFDFPEGSMHAAADRCQRIGACRKVGSGVMCPSYMATRDEEHSTRGRANALRAVLSGRVPPAEFTG